MALAKTIQLFLIDGESRGRTKCSLSNWTGVAYKVPRTMFEQSKDIKPLQQSGIYFLFGTDENGTPFIYVGQAVERKNGNGMLSRILEPHKRKKDEDKLLDDWIEAVMLTRLDNSLGPTDLNYLENRFRNLALDAGRYKVYNGNEPNPGNTTEEKQAELEEFIEYAKLVTGVLGHAVFEPLVSSSSPVEQNVALLHMSYKDSNAKGQRTSDGFVVFKNGIINHDLTNSCPDYVADLRKKYADKINPDTNEIIADLLFTSPSAAACFVGGASLNGMTSWLTKENKTLKEIEEQH